LVDCLAGFLARSLGHSPSEFRRFDYGSGLVLVVSVKLFPHEKAGKFGAAGDPKNRPLITWPERQTGLNSKINTNANANACLWLNKNHRLFDATSKG